MPFDVVLWENIAEAGLFHFRNLPLPRKAGRA
jgi:hypothetical protein